MTSGWVNEGHRAGRSPLANRRRGLGELNSHMHNQEHVPGTGENFPYWSQATGLVGQRPKRSHQGAAGTGSNFLLPLGEVHGPGVLSPLPPPEPERRVERPTTLKSVKPGSHPSSRTHPPTASSVTLAKSLDLLSSRVFIHVLKTSCFYSSVQQVFTEYLLCARHCWGHNRKNHRPCPLWRKLSLAE